MTRIVVGVDGRNAYRPVIELLNRLRFPELSLTLIHSAPENAPFISQFNDREAMEAEYAKVVTNQGQAALHEVKGFACEKGLACEAHLTHGNPAERLIAEGEQRKADVIAVNAKEAGGVGSVSRALAVASTASILVAKGERAEGETFRAVFATDHSPFAAACLERFLTLAPKGIEEIHVVGAWEIDDHEAEVLGKNLAKLGGDADRWIEETVEARNAEVCRRLQRAGYRTVSLVQRGEPTRIIHRAMADSRADLLIVGSQGSGAMAQALVGSVSLHQVTSENYPVLIIRPGSP